MLGCREFNHTQKKPVNAAGAATVTLSDVGIGQILEYPRTIRQNVIRRFDTR